MHDARRRQAAPAKPDPAGRSLLKSNACFNDVCFSPGHRRASPILALQCAPREIEEGGKIVYPQDNPCGVRVLTSNGGGPQGPRCWTTLAPGSKHCAHARVDCGVTPRVPRVESVHAREGVIYKSRCENVELYFTCSVVTVVEKHTVRNASRAHAHGQANVMSDVWRSVLVPGCRMQSSSKRRSLPSTTRILQQSALRYVLRHSPQQWLSLSGLAHTT